MTNDGHLKLGPVIGLDGTLGRLAYEALTEHAKSDPTWPPGWMPRAWDALPPNQQSAWEAAARAVARATAPQFTPIGYQGAAQHTFTTACAGFHPPGPCPPSQQPVTVHFGG